MRRIVVLLVVLLSVRALSADGRRALKQRGRDSFELTIYRPVTYQSSVAELRRLCGTERSIKACTRFFGERLECDCASRGSGWIMTGRIRLVPFMYLSDLQLATHEQLHIVDIRLRLYRYLRDLGQAEFSSRESCLEAATIQRSGFSRLMTSLIRMSNVNLH
jgi:hypothetical protein